MADELEIVGYGDAIVDGKINKITSFANEDTVFEVRKGPDGVFSLNVFEKAERRILKNPDFVDGTFKQKMSSNPKEIFVKPGTLSFSEGKYSIIDKPVVYFVESKEEFLKSQEKNKEIEIELPDGSKKKYSYNSSEISEKDFIKKVIYDWEQEEALKTQGKYNTLASGNAINISQGVGPMVPNAKTVANTGEAVVAAASPSVAAAAVPPIADDYRKLYRDYYKKVSKERNLIMLEDEKAPQFKVYLKDISLNTVSLNTVSIKADENNITMYGEDKHRKEIIPSQEYFDDIAKLANLQGRPINFGDIRDNEFKARLYLACKNNDVEMFNAPEINYAFINNLDAETKSKILPPEEVAEVAEITPEADNKLSFEESMGQRMAELEDKVKVESATDDEVNELDYYDKVVEQKKLNEKYADYKFVGKTNINDSDELAKGWHVKFYLENVGKTNTDNVNRYLDSLNRWVATETKRNSDGTEVKIYDLEVGHYDDIAKVKSNLNEIMGKNIPVEPRFDLFLSPAKSNFSVKPILESKIIELGKNENILSHEISSVAEITDAHEKFKTDQFIAYVSNHIYEKYCGEFYKGDKNGFTNGLKDFIPSEEEEKKWHTAAKKFEHVFYKTTYKKTLEDLKNNPRIDFSKAVLPITKEVYSKDRSG